MLYWIGRGIYAVLFYTLFRVSIQGAEHVPDEGGVLLVANHVSYLDPPLLGVATKKRPVHFMAKAELFDMFFLRWALPRIRVFPVRRGAADRRAIRKAVELLKQGNIVGLFPEGTRSSTGELLQAQRGAGLIAIQAGVPIVPVGLIGTFQPVSFKNGWPKINKLRVRFGQPIHIQDELSSGEDDTTENRRKLLERVNIRMMEEVATLLQR